MESIHVCCTHLGPIAGCVVIFLISVSISIIGYERTLKILKNRYIFRSFKDSRLGWGEINRILESQGEIVYKRRFRWLTICFDIFFVFVSMLMSYIAVSQLNSAPPDHVCEQIKTDFPTNGGLAVYDYPACQIVSSVQKTEYEYDVFISYSRKDMSVVKKLVNRLRKDGLRVWFDEWKMDLGCPIYLSIIDGLENSRVSVLTLSQNANDSPWVRMERNAVISRDPINIGKRFIPLRLDSCKANDALDQFLLVDYSQESENEYQNLLIFLKEKSLPDRGGSRKKTKFNSYKGNYQNGMMVNSVNNQSFAYVWIFILPIFFSIVYIYVVVFVQYLLGAESSIAEKESVIRTINEIKYFIEAMVRLNNASNPKTERDYKRHLWRIVSNLDFSMQTNITIAAFLKFIYIVCSKEKNVNSVSVGINFNIDVCMDKVRGYKDVVCKYNEFENSGNNDKKVVDGVIDDAIGKCIVLLNFMFTHYR